MKIAIGADASGFELKEAVRKHLEELNIEYTDFAKEARDYYEIVPEAVPAVQRGDFDFGILCCGTGMGMAQMANSYQGIRAAVVESTYTAKMSRAINNSNILTMGGFVVAPFMACEMVDVFLNTQITDGLDDFHDFLLDAQKRIKAVEKTIYG
ncbi:Ribose-5-phosphate isomerase B [uncultured Roseburia sp.]|uniref:RpiB/LacA/LacB family sugar-phosphate isomerase n=1 Tax=Brotonthovivens ammoniilytica TaxID=2981725 RepID=A0ABT2THX9_9FIRM|nr:RpiB/LacA/LacB family sugar-phosphate isomerase [Brotonthovivens ammoniilytica]MCU6761712.1 RpiB/LacA/LacB family sugar-phosphate isomerase [Brotonthovivens ammoniilytica]SCI44236.1 Ribose-5-phosphate isomerase B [uncultured Roseburia sp.]